ncbi:sigma-70 family RNA polymerase sigma factor [Streptomyces ipomoeae]|uniref:Sigma-70 family RNA polymerase sigma factor n=1 Tax=Streptomyces ipomoeae TaxID=103232 RepID=A0AAE8W1V1_9ACTN|nr:sigma-70 family RNA polymerase sigma factor [Streptomyces ipomoeae]TQE33589.1 sigma-70 family RNA polymerase sigma factor [Streptomyces ipomoeae]
MTPRIPSEHWGEIADLYMRFRDDMVRFAARLLASERHTAHDLVQETFKAAALRWGTLRTYGECGQRAWLYQVLKNKIFDQWGARRSAADAIGHDLVADVDTPRTAVSNLLLQMCWKVIDSMPRAQRQVALLKWQGEWTNREIGEHLNIAQSTVRVHLRNARNTLAAELGDEVVFPSEWRDERDETPGEEATG